MTTRHGWPCSPYVTGCGPMDLIAEVPWLQLRRCRGCGLLFEHPDRGAHRVDLAHVRQTYPEAPAIAPQRPLTGAAADVVEITAELNRGELVRLRIATAADRWQVSERGVLAAEVWMPPAELLPRSAPDDLAPCTRQEALALTRRCWGSDAAAALDLAVSTGFDARALHALDVVQGFRRSTWERPWQPGTAEIVTAMLAADAADRVGAAVRMGLQRGLTSEDLTVFGLVLTA